MKLTDEQEAVLELIAEKHDAFIRAEKREKEIALRQAEDRIRTFRDDRDHYVALAADKGVPWTQIALKGLGMKGRQAAKEAAENGKQFLIPEATVTATQIEQGSQKFDWDAEQSTLTVTLQPADFTPYRALLAEVPTGEAAYRFTFRDGVLLPENDEADETWLHPVVQAVMTERFRQEAIEWIKEQN